MKWNRTYFLNIVNINKGIQNALEIQSSLTHVVKQNFKDLVAFKKLRIEMLYLLFSFVDRWILLSIQWP